MSTVVVAVTAMSFLSFASADASVAEGYISGTGAVTDDWADEGELARDTFPNSNATGLWQHILVADGYLAAGDVDCRFGPRTEAATRRWQDDRNLGIDGRVGRQTFSRADNNLTLTSDGIVVEYRGTRYNEYFRRENNVYYLYPGVPSYYRSINPNC